MISRFPSLGSALLLAAMVVGGLVAPAPVQAWGPTADLDSALAEVDKKRAQGDFREALTSINVLREEHGDHVELLWRASLTRVDLAKTTDGEQARDQHYKKALELAETALTVDDKSARAHLAKAVAEGRLALEAGTRERVERSRAVEKHATRAIELDSTLAGAHHVLGRWNREVSDLNFVERTVVKTVYGGLPEASFEQSVTHFKRAIALENVRFHHLELAKTYLKMERPSDARSELQTALELPAKEPFADKYKEEAQTLLEEME